MNKSTLTDVRLNSLLNKNMNWTSLKNVFENRNALISEWTNCGRHMVIETEEGFRYQLQEGQFNNHICFLI